MGRDARASCPDGFRGGARAPSRGLLAPASAQYAEWLASDDAALIVADEGESLLGYAVVRVGSGAATWDIGERVAELESLSVAAPARGGGVGAALVQAARAFARERGAQRLTVSVVHNNEGALRFYAREGFEPFYVLLLERPED